MAKATLTLELSFPGPDGADMVARYRITGVKASESGAACYVTGLDSQDRPVTAFVEERSNGSLACSGEQTGNDYDHDFARALGIAFDSALSDLAALGL